ncbi:MAG: NAAT family transporter [Burkholderiales bacterium]|nr:NAAT family transporter [Burkholderiales bacterium]
MPDFPLRPLVEQTLLVFAALFPIVNPVGGAPVFLAMTHGLSDVQRQHLARRIGVNAFLLVLVSFFVGNHVIEFFGLSVPVIQVGGGLLVCAMAWRLLHEESTDEVPVRPQTHDELAVRAFYPMTMPLTVGPGSIAVAITLGAHVPRGMQAYAIGVAGATIGALLLALSIYLLFRYAERLTRVLGPTGTAVLLRLSAFILLCIGVQIVWSGVEVLLRPLAA